MSVIIFHFRRILGTCLVSLLPLGLAAEPSHPIFSVNEKGLIVQSDDGAFSIRLRPRLQIDGHYFSDDENGPTEFFVRRAQMVFQGTAGSVNWLITPELAGTTKILDASIDLHLGDTDLVRVGKFKGVIGLERRQSFSKTLFIERGLPSGLTPTREIGIEYQHTPVQGILSWAVGLYNGTLDDSDLTLNQNLSSGDFDLGAGLTWKPSSSLSLGCAVSVGEENVVLDTSDSDRRLRYRSAGRQTFFQYESGVTANGQRLRINPHIAYYRGSFGFLSEYLISRYTLERDEISKEISTKAWTIQASWVLTGENASFNGVRPLHPFNPSEGQWGAWEIGVRLHGLHADKEAFGNGETGAVFATSKSVQNADGVSLGLNGYLTANLRCALNFEHTTFSGLGADRGDETALLTRLQLDF